MADKVEIVEKFFERLSEDEELKEKLDKAVAMYPGSLEIREALCLETLLPVAEEAGYPFDISDLRKYETRIKMRHNLDVEIDPDEPDEEITYWLLDRGWTDDEAKFGI